MGAWIETMLTLFALVLAIGVAPRVGAWIETYSPAAGTGLSTQSHPVWVRGLKRSLRWALLRPYNASHPVWVRGLKPYKIELYDLVRNVSHPVWVRGLKQY